MYESIVCVHITCKQLRTTDDVEVKLVHKPLRENSAGTHSSTSPLSLDIIIRVISMQQIIQYSRHTEFTIFLQHTNIVMSFSLEVSF